MEEISLREMVEILYKYKILIIGIVIVSLLFSVAYAFLIAEPMYSAQAEIELTAIDTGVSSVNYANDPNLVADTLIAQMKDPQIMYQVGKALEINNIIIDQNAIKSATSISKGKDGKTISILVKYKEKKAAAHIANTFADVLSDYSTLYLKEQIQQQITITEERIKQAKAISDQALSKYKEYALSQESYNRLQSELDINKSIIAQLKGNLICGNIGLGKSKEQLEQDIINLDEEITVLNEKLVDASSNDRLLQVELDSSLEIYSSFNEEYNKLKLAESYYKNKSNIKILSYAAEPESPSSPKKKEIIIISLLAGVCIGVLTSFAIDFFKSRK